MPIQVTYMVTIQEQVLMTRGWYKASKGYYFFQEINIGLTIASDKTMLLSPSCSIVIVLNLHT